MSEFADVFPQVYYVDIKQSKSRWPRRRPQRWFFVVLAAGNHEPVMTSEMYTDRGMCVEMARKVNGDKITVFLRQPEQGNSLLRRSVPE